MPTKHVVKAGESVVSLSERYGLYAQTIWDAPENADLRAARPDMNTLLPGDILTIPDIRQKVQAIASGQLHCFRRKGIPAHFRLQLYDYGEPRKNQEFTLEVDGETIEGTSDGDGVIDLPLPAGARKGVLTIGEDKLQVALAFGHLDPIAEVSGIQQRLGNLGYDCGPANGEVGPRTQHAIAAFQRAQDKHLEVTGELDQPTRDRIEALHDAVAEDTHGSADEDAQA
ncbi:MAG: peptidoglycan-binding protein [Myxococcota bacterium]